MRNVRYEKPTAQKYYATLSILFYLLALFLYPLSLDYHISFEDRASIFIYKEAGDRSLADITAEYVRCSFVVMPGVKEFLVLIRKVTTITLITRDGILLVRWHSSSV